jgi:hypothetical protein
MNKKGFELVWSSVVIIALALVFLVVMVIFFLSSSGNFFDNIKTYFSYSNADSVVNSCNLLADSGQTNVYCCEKKTVKYYQDGEKLKEELTCLEVGEKGFASELKELNCNVTSC